MLPSIVNYLPCICPLHPVHIRTDWAPLNDVMGQIWPADLGFDTWFKRHDHVLVCHNHTELCVCIQSTILILKEEVKTEQKHLTTSWINLSLCCHCFLKNMSLGNSGNDCASRFSSVTVVSAHTHTHIRIVLGFIFVYFRTKFKVLAGGKRQCLPLGEELKIGSETLLMVTAAVWSNNNDVLTFSSVLINCHITCFLVMWVPLCNTS